MPPNPARQPCIKWTIPTTVKGLAPELAFSADRADLRLPGAARRGNLDRLAGLAAEQGRPERRGRRDRAGPADGAHLDRDRFASLVLDLDEGADAHLVAARLFDDLGVVEPGAQRPDARLEEALLVLCGVVLEVLGQVAELARLLDRGDHLLATRPFELGYLRPQRLRLLRGQPLVYHFDLRPRREVYTSFGRASVMPAASNCSVWPFRRATRLTSACC